jgi:hypothetical protein
VSPKKVDLRSSGWKRDKVEKKQAQLIHTHGLTGPKKKNGLPEPPEIKTGPPKKCFWEGPDSK